MLQMNETIYIEGLYWRKSKRGKLALRWSDVQGWVKGSKTNDDLDKAKPTKPPMLSLGEK